ncbi:MAG: DNA-directed RNA polymerase subunit RpoH/Rpb5 C-terminal domain-containing protein, partial [Thermococcus sp.]
MAAKKEFDIFTHVLVPEHRILSEEEKEELLKKYRIRISQL